MKNDLRANWWHSPERLHRDFREAPSPLWIPDQGGTAVSDVPKREDIEDKYKWDLSDLFPSVDAWQADAKRGQELTEKLATYEGRLGESAQTLLEALKIQDELFPLVHRLGSFASRWHDEDTANPKAQDTYNRYRSFAVQISSRLAFIDPELLTLEDGVIEGFLNSEPALAPYRFYFETMLRQKAHVLSTEQEQVLAEFGEIMGSPYYVFHSFNDADIRFPMVKDDEGNDIELTHGRYHQLIQTAKKQEVRKEASEAMSGTYQKLRNTLATVYSTRVKTGVVNARIRNYESALQSSLYEDNVPVSVYDNLISSVRDALPALHKYFRLRKKVLGLDELHMYDTYVPIVSDFDMKVPYDEAVDMVLKAIAPLGPSYVADATNGLRGSRWVDVYETRAKRSGGYCAGAYPVHPYILLNYQETLDDTFTLIHELGHAMHYYYSFKTQPFVYSDTPIFIAEVASTFNESLLVHHLLNTTDDKKMRAYVLNQQIDTIRATVYTQTLYAEFEKLSHAHAEQGGSLTADWLCDTWHRLNEDYHGAACALDEVASIGWARIPHFYTPFYVYKYATGLSAAVALSQKVINEGQPAVEKYLNFLHSGSSDYVIELLRKAGVDMASPEPVKATLRLFDELVDELSSLV